MCPQLSFTTVTNSATRCQYLYPDTQMYYDIGNDTLPNFSFWSPNNQHNGHDNGYASAGAYISTWLDTWYYPYLETTWRDTLFFLTWDEDAGEENNRVLTMAKHPCIGPGTVDTKMNLYSLTRLIEENWDLGTLGQYDDDAYNAAAFIPANKSCSIKGIGGGSGSKKPTNTKRNVSDYEIGWDKITSPHYSTKPYRQLKNFGISALVIVLLVILLLASWACYKHPRRKPITQTVIETALTDATTFSQHKPQDDYNFYEPDENYLY